jgi:hypothetical protein
MSTPTTARGALLRRAGTLLVAVALVGGPTTTAFADVTTQASPTSSASASPTPTASASAEATPTTSPPVTTSPSPSDPAPSPSASATPTGPVATTGPSATTSAGGSSARLAAAAGVAAPQSAYAADFLARTLAAGGDHYVYPLSTVFDGGNTIDAILALDGIGAGADEADAAFAYLEANIGGYIGTDFASLYAGPTAKLLLAVVAHGGDPTAFGGLDLVAKLKSTEGAVEPGRFSDLPLDCGFPQCDFSNTIGQSLAIVALVRAGEPISTASVDFLLAQQCTDGGFRINMDAQGCTSDADATSFAVQALLAAGSAAAAGDALDHLAAVQLHSGGLVSDDGVANANTTAVAAQAFAAGGRDADLADARGFLVSLQYTCSSPAALRGGIAFSTAKRSTKAPSDEDLRATPQSALALSGQSLLSVERSEGASTGTTATPCSTTPHGEPSSSVDPTSTGGATAGAGGSTPSTTVDASGTGSLAQTGTDLLAPALLGLLLMVVGGLAVWAGSRRRGAHA